MTALAVVFLMAITGISCNDGPCHRVYVIQAEDQPVPCVVQQNMYGIVRLGPTLFVQCEPD